MDGVRVVMAEDDENLRALLATGLKHFGFDVTPVGDGSTVVETVESVDPQVLLLDVGMPGLDGLEVCRLLRRRGHTLPILFLSARDSAEDRAAAADAGGDEYLVKPIGFAELVDRLETHVALARDRARGR